MFCIAMIPMIGMTCRQDNSPDLEDPYTDDQEEMNQEIHGTGTIVWNDFEGGFFGIEDSSGSKYYPLNPLHQTLQVDGTGVEFVLRIEPHVMTTVMWGKPVTVIAIKKVDS